MWINPNHPDRERLMRAAAPTTTDPPDETGRRLATLPRSRRGGPDEELRVSLDEYQGHPYVSVRVWTRDQQGQCWPVKGKGVSVRLAELSDVADALKAAGRIADQDNREASPRASAPSRPARPQARGQQALPEAAGDAEPFDEF